MKMKSLSVESTYDSPKVILDPPGDFLIEGKSFPEDCTMIYNPIIDWLEGYALTPFSHQLDFRISLSYISSTSSLSLIKILKILKDMKEKGKDVKVSWLYEEDDDDIKSLGEKYEKVLMFPFDYKEIKC